MKLLLTLFFSIFSAQGKIQDKKIPYVQIPLPQRTSIQKYQIQIFADQDLKEKVFEKISNRPEITWDNPNPGKYFYRVRHFDNWGQQSTFSKLSQLNITDEH